MKNEMGIAKTTISVNNSQLKDISAEDFEAINAELEEITEGKNFRCNPESGICATVEANTRTNAIVELFEEYSLDYSVYTSTIEETEETAEENIAVEEAVIENNTNTNAAENSVATEKTTAKFEAGKTYFYIWNEDTGRPHMSHYTVTKRTAKTVVINGYRLKIHDWSDTNNSEAVKVSYGRYILAKDLCTVEAENHQVEQDKAWDKMEADADRRCREVEAEKAEREEIADNETDGSEEDMDREETFNVMPVDENDAEDELIDEAAEIVANVENATREVNSEVSLTSNDTPKIKVDRNAKFKAGIKNQTIGVEIEFTGITRGMAAEAVANFFGTASHYEGGEHCTWVINDKSLRTWKIMLDTSLIPQCKNGDGREVGADGFHRCELVTPILRWNDIETLQGVAGAIVAAGGFVNKSCGLHVHIGGDGFTAQALRNLVNIVGSRENLFYEAFAVNDYREDYCRPTNKMIIRELNENKPSTLDEVKEIWYNGRTSRADSHYDDSRYTIVNLHSFFNKGTVEFRLFNSTLDGEEIATAIHFSAALADMAKRKSRTIYEVLTDRPFERMSRFLGRLKLTGDEFKTTRYHILKHLTPAKAGQTAVA